MQNLFLNQNLCQDDNQFHKGRCTHTRASVLVSRCPSLNSNSLLLFSTKRTMRHICRTKGTCSHIIVQQITFWSWKEIFQVGRFYLLQGHNATVSFTDQLEASFGHSAACSLALSGSKAGTGPLRCGTQRWDRYLPIMVLQEKSRHNKSLTFLRKPQRQSPNGWSWLSHWKCPLSSPSAHSAWAPARPSPALSVISQKTRSDERAFLRASYKENLSSCQDTALLPKKKKSNVQKLHFRSGQMGSIGGIYYIELNQLLLTASKFTRWIRFPQKVLNSTEERSPICPSH